MPLKLIHIKHLVLVLFVFCGLNEVRAAHIVGGEVTFQFVRFNIDSSEITYFIEFTMYRDQFSNGAPFDEDADFGVYRRNLNGGWSPVFTVEDIDPTTPQVIEIVDDPCVEEPINQVGVERAMYTFSVTLDVINSDYLISYQRCCRNNIIANIANPGDTGAAFDVIITSESQRLGNSSPQFNTFPPVFICSGFDLDIDHPATDAEGDLLRYTFCAPFTAGGTVDANTGNLGCCDCVRPIPGNCAPPYANVTFVPPFAPSQPLGGSPLVQINNNTGFINGRPQQTGTFVVGVCVEEFRNGVSLSQIRRDFQFTVLACARSVTADLASDSEIPDPNSAVGVNAGNSNIFLINSCGDFTIDFINESTEESSIVDYHWTFFDEFNNLLEDRQGPNERDVSITFPGLGEYTGTMIVNEGLECSDTAPFIINLFPSIDADYTFDFDTCLAGPIEFVDLSETGGDMITDWDWDFSDGNSSDIQSPSHLFRDPGTKNVSLIVTDNNECTDEMVIDVPYFPVPSLLIIEPSSFIGCTPSEIFFNNLSDPIDSTYMVLWDFGDGTMVDEISPTHTYLEAGNFNVSLEVISPIGCQTAMAFDGLVRVEESPVADFSCFPENPNTFNRVVRFTDASAPVNAWQWQFGDFGTSFEQNPTVEFPDTGVYRVLLTTFHPVTNCPDTISKLVDVTPVVEFHFPNAFTPNNDSSNDLFLGNGFYDGLVDYTISIWNRWGQKIFESDNPRQGWNGQEFNTGTPSPQGVYIYQAQYRDPRGDRISVDGHVTLVR